MPKVTYPFIATKILDLEINVVHYVYDVDGVEKHYDENIIVVKIIMHHDVKIENQMVTLLKVSEV